METPQPTEAVAESFPEPQLDLTNLEGDDDINTKANGDDESNTKANGDDDNNTKANGSTDPEDQPFESEPLEKMLNYVFKDKNLLKKAFTDSTYVEKKYNSYDLLELLGDAVLNLVVIYEFVKLYPKESSGPLTKLRAVNVDTDKLARVAVKHEIYRFLRHKKPTLKEEIQEFVEAIKEHPIHSHGLLHVPKSLANIVESTTGAIFMDCESIKTVWEVMKPIMEPIIPLDKLEQHPMTELNELCQKRKLKLSSVDTWEEDKTYKFMIEDKVVGCGAHLNKKETARYRAAQNAVENFSKVFGDL
ncbi:hypothetical protein CARUB_v10007185mg [Capsella rubella]|uniref:RNase III domain-containing protein n=1 Tax=Capsella rubella TaxID=81985 RepID=R0F9H2_9BRAS|nr:ribonuclease 3-like protein 3 [Capsella rubella]EOA18612.1 hypothetical protein CARUB_v10007185mg [Capsella rubella]